MMYTRLLVSSCAAAMAAGISTPAFAGDIAGHVSDATQTIALQSAEVRIVELDRVATTARDGSFNFPDVTAGTYTIQVRYIGAQTVSQTVQVAESGTVSVDVTLGGSNEILVVGQAANQASSLSRQKAADGVSSVLTRDAIGEFPDQNVAESLRRLPGVNILNDQGEGRFVSVRGLDPDLNSTSVDGVRIPAPESDIRAVALDVISSDTIESIEVKKSFTPDMDGDFIGASVEIKTASAFDSRKNRYSLTAEGSYNDYSGKVTPKGGFDFTQKLGDHFGVAGSVSYYERQFETDNVEADNWVESGGAYYTPSLEYRDYDVTRKRFNAALSFDWRVSGTTKAYIRGNWAQFDDHEYRRRTTFDLSEFEDDGPSSVNGSTVSFDTADQEITVERDLKDRFERQRIRSVSVGSETDTGTWKFDWQASYAKSSERENFSLDPVRFASSFDDESGVVIDFDNSGRYFPVYSITSGASEVNDPTNYTLDRVELTTLSDSTDEEYALKANLARTFAMSGGDFTVQAGAKARWREKSYDFEMTRYKKSKNYTLADVLGEQTYRLLDMGPVMSKTDTAQWFLDNEADLSINDYASALDSATSDYSVKEDVTAAYLLGRWDSATLRAIGGVRMEHTRNELNGNVVTDDEDTYDLPLVEPVQYKRSYTNWLPSLTFRYTPQDNLVFRLAGYKTLVRPKLAAMAPRSTVNEDNEAEFGNPDLLPYEAWNADIGAAYYFSGNGAISIGGFYKDIKNYAVTQTFDNYTCEGETYDQFTTTINGDSARVIGFEASYSQVYDMLPAPFDGLLTQLNYTYTDSKATLADGREISMPNASRNTFNVVLGFDKGPIDMRLSGTYRDKYLDEVGDSAEEDRIVNNHFQLDFSAKFKVMENLRLTLDVININNAKYFAYQNFGGAQRLLQYEEYGPTFKFGAKVTF
ncbi:MAG: TonB-dependent receptor [Candidatus Andeanibacterium colombiense]|uniref:TonB-dependent receptor n=1 Tax=Candidatus Andeanibacterium colombiense TaxID=3121345 RepID=A0AAJ5X1Q6_9SPHN|nr:MAG: TonB-dependent receptor [Sphingomonadaceae bacterium]